jgi:outer membrane protein TolC
MGEKLAYRFALVFVLIGSVCLRAEAQYATGQRAQMFPAPSIVPSTEELRVACVVRAGEGVPIPFHLSLADAKARTLQSSVVMELASTQIAAKSFTMQAAGKDYFPKLVNSFMYFHFDGDLGTVVRTPGIFNPATAISVAVINQDAPVYTALAVQPITPLLKVREAVNITAADVEAAEAQKRQARRELSKGVEQLYFGILATQQIKSGLQQAVAGAQQAADASKTPDAQISLIQAQQALLQAEGQLVDLYGQMNQLISLPPQTVLELEQPPAPSKPFTTVEAAMSSAVATSPKIQEARSQVDKAEAACRLYRADYVPQVLAYALYEQQSAVPAIQEDFTGVGVSASYTLEWGKKTDTYRAGMATLCLARQALQKEVQDTSLAAAKAYNATEQAEQGLTYAQKLAALNQQVPEPTNDMTAMKAELQARLESGIAAIKAELDYRTAIVELRSMTGTDDLNCCE